MNAADTAWILAALTAVSLMIPGLALFYGGMVGTRSVLNMIMMVFGGVALTGVLWTLFGYTAVFGNSYGGLGLLGNLTEYPGLGSLLGGDPEAALPPALVAAFQALFAGITVALIAGALVDRVRFGGWLLFAGLWVALVYLPIAHWVFAFDAEDGSTAGGWIANDLGAVDFAGGTAVHINSGVAALAAVLVLGKRRGWPHQPRPNNLPLTVLGAGILWFGWFGFNGGSALAANNDAGVVVLNTFNAACAGVLAWAVVERFRDGHATSLGAASGAIAGLVAITPACGAVSPVGAIVVGLIAGIVCPLAIGLKYRLGYDDSLDVVAVHLVGGLVGTLLVGFLATAASPNDVNGLFYGGDWGVLAVQAVAAGAVLGYSFVVTMLLTVVLDKMVGLRLDSEKEQAGVDTALHAEVAYDFGGAMHHASTVEETDVSAAAEQQLSPGRTGAAPH